MKDGDFVMSANSGDRFSIRIGGNASGPVVAGHNNHIEDHHLESPPQPDATPPEEHLPAESVQTNNARERGTVFAVTNGDMHVRQEGSHPSVEPE